MSNEPKIEGILAEFKNPAELLEVAKKLREAGFKKYDCHSPFPIHGMDDAMGEKRSPLGWMVGIVAAVMFTAGFAFEGWTSAIDYPLVVSGKPFFSYQAFGTVAFALMVLTSALTALVGMLILNKLPRFYHATFHSENFGRVSDDSFFVSVESDDEQFDRKKTEDFLKSLGGTNIELLIDKSE
jgi:hypothetical protein